MAYGIYALLYRSIAFYFCPFLCTKTINLEHSNSTIVFSWFWFSDDLRSLFGWGFICLASCQFSSFNKMVTLDLVIWYGFRLFFCLFIQGHWSQNPSSYSLNQNWPNSQILFLFCLQAEYSIKSITLIKYLRQFHLLKRR